jgi:hypothetical protein
MKFAFESTNHFLYIILRNPAGRQVRNIYIDTYKYRSDKFPLEINDLPRVL